MLIRMKGLANVHAGNSTTSYIVIIRAHRNVHILFYVITVPGNDNDQKVKVLFQFSFVAHLRSFCSLRLNNVIGIVGFLYAMM